jgi:hypothetical protein
MTSRMRRLAALLAALTLVGLSASTVAAAKPVRPPANDDIGAPTVVGSFPYSASQNTTLATTGKNDPTYCGLPELGQDRATVWYSFTPTASMPTSIGATTYGSDYDTTLYVGTPDGAGGFVLLACADDAGGTAQSAVRFDASPGKTYLFMVGTCCGGGTPGEIGGGGNLVFNITEAPPAMRVELIVDSSASVTRSGVVTITGTLSCTAPADDGARVVVEIQQAVANRFVEGNAFEPVEGCPGSGIRWAVEVAAAEGAFQPGPARVRVDTAACNLFECGSQTIEQIVRFRR